MGLKIDILLDKIIGADLSVSLNDPSDIMVTELTSVPVSGPPAKLEDNEFAGLITSLDPSTISSWSTMQSSAMTRDDRCRRPHQV